MVTEEEEEEVQNHKLFFLLLCEPQTQLGNRKWLVNGQFKLQILFSSHGDVQLNQLPQTLCIYPYTCHRGDEGEND